MSFALVATLVCIFPLTQFADTRAMDSGNKTDSAYSMDESSGIPTGMLSGTGTISINGNPTDSGATILNGNVISSGADGNASIEMYGLGRIVLTPNTTARLDMSPNRIQVTVTGTGKLIQSVPSGIVGQVKFAGDKTNLNVIRGELSAESNTGIQTVKAGQNVNIASLNATVSKGDTLFEAESTNSEAPPAPQGTPAGSNGFLGHGALVGIIIASVTAVIIIGVVVHNNDDSTLSSLR
jgi:hypothetical protein